MGSPHPDDTSRASTIMMTRPNSSTMLLSSSSPRLNRRPESTPGHSQADVMYYGSRSPSPSPSAPLAYHHPGSQRRGSQGSGSVMLPSRPASVHALGGPRERRYSSNSLFNFSGAPLQAQPPEYFGADNINLSNLGGGVYGNGKPYSTSPTGSNSPDIQAMPGARSSNAPGPRAADPPSHDRNTLPPGAAPPVRPVRSPRRQRTMSEVLQGSDEKHLLPHADTGRVPSTSGEGMTGESGVTGTEGSTSLL